MTYTAFDRPYINLQLESEVIDINVAALPSLLREHLGADSDSRVVSGFQAMDFDLDVKIDQVAREGLVMNDFELLAQSRNRRLAIDRLVASLPGAYLSALGVVDMSPSGWSSQLGLRVDADDFTQLAQAVPVDWFPGGAGALSLALVLNSGESGLDMSGQGAIEVWNGRWPLLQRLVYPVWAESASENFEFLSSPIDISAGAISLSEFQMVNEQLVAQGQLTFEWPPGPLLGVLDLTRQQGYQRVQISGSMDQPELETLLPAAGVDP